MVNKGIEIAKCFGSIGVAIATLGAEEPEVQDDCSNLLAEGLDSIIKKFMTQMMQKADPPAFLSEMRWTDKYLADVRATAFDGSSQTSGKHSLADFTFAQVSCQVQELRKYTETNNLIEGYQAGDFVNANHVRKVCELEAAEELKASRIQMLEALQLVNIGLAKKQTRPRDSEEETGPNDDTSGLVNNDNHQQHRTCTRV